MARSRLALLLPLLLISLQPTRAAWSDGWPGPTCIGGTEAKQCNAPGEGCNVVDCARDARCFELQCGNGDCSPVCIKSPDSTALCPDGKPPATCLIDPCSTLTCKEGDACVPHYCDRDGGACTATCEATPGGGGGGSSWPPGLTCPDGTEAKQCSKACNLFCIKGSRCLEVQCGDGACTTQCVKIPDSTALCPDGKPPATCLIDPCSTLTCKEGTACVPHYCDRDGGACTATCEATPGGGSGGSSCPPGVSTVNCLVDPCDPRIAPRCAKGEQCYSNYCGGCNAVCRKPCPDGQPAVQCLVNPCHPSINPCGAGEACTPDYCGGCKAVCSKAAAGQLCPGGKNPRKSCPVKSAGSRPCKGMRPGYGCVPSNPCNCNKPSKPVKLCPDGKPPVQCLLSPCHPSINPCNADETCTPDYCSADRACKAVCKAKTTPSPCPNGEPLAQCKRSPCDPGLNPCAKGTTCEANYCGGCRAICSSSGACPPGVPPVKCFADPCSTKTCPKGTTCEANYCGGCNALCVRADTCPAGAPEVTCIANPCQPSLNACKDGQVCTVNRCGECSAVCSDPDSSGSAVIEPIDFTTCRGGGNPVACFVNPCDTGGTFAAKCPVDLQCVPEYCGGCNYDCLPKTPCANGLPRRACTGTANGCMLAKCGWGATCVPDQCGNCGARCVGPCDPGSYINPGSVNGPSCEPCPAGFSCPAAAKGQPTPEPQPCNGGYFSSKPGQTDCEQCPSGTTTPAQPADKGYTACT